MAALCYIYLFVLLKNYGCLVIVIQCVLFQPAEETQIEDECPSDVDLNDPYFAEELGKAG